MDAPNSRTRSKIALDPARLPSLSSSRHYLPQMLASNALFVLSLYLGKVWLLEYETGVFWLLMRVLACGGIPVALRQAMAPDMTYRAAKTEWSVLGVSSLALFVQQACTLTALLRLSPFRVILFTSFSSAWLGSLLRINSPKQAFAIAAALVLLLTTDGKLSMADYRTAIVPFGALVLHAISSSTLEHTQSILLPSLGAAATLSMTIIFASVIGLPTYIVRKVLHNPAPGPVLPLVSLCAIPLLAYSLLWLTPKTSRSMGTQSSPRQAFLLSFFSRLGFALVVGIGAFSIWPSWADVAVAGLLCYGTCPPSSNAIPQPPRTPASRLIRSYVKTVLSNSESRKIFYFLMLNMAFMLVQMLYGIWTNSLGLISDAIHMAFDCMAIAVGLLASIMATWPPNERFTYGYGRIETLSGFANGIFLILISVFIVFEAIERLLEPPEMNTSQLLLVSSLGLGVNLFGMFAMGGHHHHGGHSHSHGHSHSSGSSHSGHSHSEHTHSQSEPSHSGHGGHTHGGDDEHPRALAHVRSPGPIKPSRSRLAQSHLPDSTPPSPDASMAHTNRDHFLSSHDSPDDSSFALPSSHSSTHSHHDDEPHRHVHPHSHSSTAVFAQPESPRQLDSDLSPHSHEHSHDHSHGHSHSHSHSHLPLASKSKTPHKRTSFPGANLRIDHRDDTGPRKGPLSATQALLSAHSMTDSPITPNYRFGHDDHYESHHHDEHVPNLHNHSHVHGHHEGHSHNMRGVFLHVMADTLGSVGVIISTLLIQFYGWTGFDPIASLFIAILIAASVIPLVIDTGKVLCLDVTDRETSIQMALAELSAIHGLQTYHAPRFWPKDSSSLIGSIRVVLSPTGSSVDTGGPHATVRGGYADVDRVVEQVDALLRKGIQGLEELTIQVEGSDTRTSPL